MTNKEKLIEMWSIKSEEWWQWLYGMFFSEIPTSHPSYDVFDEGILQEFNEEEATECWRFMDKHKDAQLWINHANPKIMHLVL